VAAGAGLAAVTIASAAVSGLARLSRLTRSAFTPKSSSAIPPMIIAIAPMRKPTNTWLSLPLSIRCANSNGPTIPPTPVPTA
jgi:hypothetical protein